MLIEVLFLLMRFGGYKMIIRKYNKEYDEDNLMALIKNEGQGWSCYWADNLSEKYKAALKNLLLT